MGTVSVIGDEEEWDYHMESEKMPELLGFGSFVIVDNYDPLELDIRDQLGLLNENDAFSNKSLLIVVKTRSISGFCYIGLNLEEGRFYRPICRDAPQSCCWPRSESFKIGQFYGFKQVFRDPNTRYPHKNDDLLVSANDILPGDADPIENLEMLMT